MRKTETVTFFNYQVVIEDAALSQDLLEPLIKEGFNKSLSETAMQQVTALVDTENSRFIRFVFSSGDVFPLPPNLISTENGKQIKNRRKKTEIEPKYLYGVMDCKTGEIWLQYKARLIFKESLKSHYPEKHIEMKQVLDEEQFIKQINELSEIKLGVKPDLFHTTTLSKSLQEDIYLFGAASAEIIFKYQATNFFERTRHILTAKNLLNNKKDFKKLVIVGRNTDKLDLIFNNEIISSKVGVVVPVDENGMIKEEELFKQVKSRILDIGK